MIMTKKMTSRSVLVLAGFSLALAGSACGDDGGSSNNSNKPAKKPNLRVPPPAAPAAAAGVGGKGLLAYTKVDDELRHQLTEIDFVPDVSGEVNRDPFRSWLQRVAVDSGDGPTTIDICSEGNVRWGAPSYSVRDLSLVGLVKRGRSFAQFVDKSEADSWIVRKGDCLGQEKAIIEEVGVGYVRLSITPPAPPGSPAPPAQKQDIPLHPDELEIPDAILGNFDDE
jgi:hypothetical protein